MMAAMSQDGRQLEPAAALDALEAFVVDNDDLAQLEERIGRFNIFDALGIVRAEIRHSQFLAWLLDPGESHGAGQLFLRAVIMDMLARAPRGLRPCSPVELDGLDLGQVELHRERDHIDILIVIDEPRLVFAIENKVDSGEHSGQLERYRDVVARRYPDHQPLLVYLTRQGEEPSDEAWSPYSYADLHRTLARVRRLNEGGVGEDVAAFLDHYLRMIGSRFMDDPKIDELCERIYKNHRQALELIFERRPDARRRLVTIFADELESQDDYWSVSRAALSCDYLPLSWLEIQPAVARTGKIGPNALIRCYLWIGPTGSAAVVHVTPATNAQVRARLIEAIRADGDTHGFRVTQKKSGDEWSAVFNMRIVKSKNPLEADDETEEKFRAAARKMREVTERMTPFLEAHFGATPRG
jgi:hypothetical protein